jgi:type I restriction enzyme S subunit
MAGRYKPYPEYKDSGVDWIGKIPCDWDMWKITHACPYVASGTTPKADGDVYYGGENLWVTTGELREGVIFDTLKKVTDKALLDMPTLRLHPRGSVSIAMYGATIGRLGIFGKEAATNQACCVMPPSATIQNKYLFYWLYATRQEIINLSSGGGQPNVNQEKIASLKVSCPNYNLQTTIANFLDHETAKIDTLIEKQQQLIKLLKEKRQAVISHAVTKGLNPVAKLRDSGIEWLGEVPEHWIVAGFKKYLNSIVDYRGKTPEKHDSGVFLVTARNIKSGAINYDASQEYISEDDYESVMCRGKPKIGDLLFTTEAPLGEVASVDREDIALAQRVIKFDGQPGILNNFYLKYLIMSMQFQQSLMMFSSGSTAPGIKAERFVYLRSLIPPLSEQLEIVDYIESVAKKIDNLIVKAIDGIEIMQERRTALISAAVTGKIDVRGWAAPQDSPTHKEVAA